MLRQVFLAGSTTPYKVKEQNLCESSALLKNKTVNLIDEIIHMQSLMHEHVKTYECKNGMQTIVCYHWTIKSSM